jgi:uncharacterized protein (TIGR02996 family)
VPRADLLAAVYANPADDGPRAAYARSLLETSHPLGEFIQLQLARANGVRDTKLRERRLFDPAWWNDHPVAIARRSSPESRPTQIQYEDTDRGFPAVFKPAIGDGERGDSWIPLVGHPGWSTVREIDAYLDSEVFAFILEGTKMPLLERLSDVGPITLASLAYTSLPIRTLRGHGEKVKRLPRMSRLRRLTELRWHFEDGTGDDRDVSLPQAIELLSQLGVFEQIVGLEVSGVAWSKNPAREAQDALAKLPRNVERLRVNGVSVERRAGP